MRTRSFFPDPDWDRPTRISRRVAMAFAISPFLARCSSDPNSDTASLAKLMGRSFDVFSPDSSVSLEEVAAIPFASLGVRVGSGAQTLLVLATRSAQDSLWTSASHIALEMDAGRITRTAGLPHNLSATVVSGTDPLETGLQNLRQSAETMRTLDFADRNAFGNLVQSSIVPQGPAQIDVLGTLVKTVHAIEHCTCAALGWTFANQYWADARSGLVWRSSQFIHPDLDAVEVQIFRPPKGST